MKTRALGSLFEWDEVRLIEAEAGRYLGAPSPSDEDVRKGSQILGSIPRLQSVEATAGDVWFGVAPGPGQPSSQLALAVLLRAMRFGGWQVSNIRRRFSPALARYVAKRYGRHTLGWWNSWCKIVAPPALVIERHRQRHPASVDNMVAALGGRAPIIDVDTFFSLSKESVWQALPPEEKANYLRSRDRSRHVLGS